MQSPRALVKVRDGGSCIDLVLYPPGQDPFPFLQALQKLWSTRELQQVSERTERGHLCWPQWATLSENSGRHVGVGALGQHPLDTGAESRREGPATTTQHLHGTGAPGISQAFSWLPSSDY